MPITNFSNLLDDVLKGKPEALAQWDQYRIAKSFEQKDIDATLERIQGLLPPDSHSSFLKAYMHEYGQGYVQNYKEAFTLYILRAVTI